MAEEENKSAETPAPALKAEGVAISQVEYDALQQELASLRGLSDELLTEVQQLSGEPYIPIREARVAKGIGKYMEPVAQTLNDHYQLIFDRSNKLDFWPEDNPAFDGVVAGTFLPAAFNTPEHPNYFNYEPLRDNLATVRNVLMNMLVDPIPEGDGHDKANHQALLKLEQMAREIGVSMERDKLLLPGPNTTTLNTAALAEPGIGAAKMYEFLLKKQNRSMWLHPIDWLRGRDYSHWNLPPLEQSPFSAEHVAQFHPNYTPPGVDPRAPDVELPTPEIAPITPEAAPEAAKDPFSIGHEIALAAASATAAAHALRSVDTLPRPVKNRAVELARDILDKLKIRFCDDTAIEWMQHPSDETLAMGESIAEVLTLYNFTFHNALAENPDLQQDAALSTANLAAGKLAYVLKMQALAALERETNPDDAALVLGEIQSMPDSWKQLGADETIASLLEQVDQGIEVSHAAAMQAQEVRMRGGQQQDGVANAQAQQEALVAAQRAREKRLALEEALHHGISAEELSAMKSLGSTMSHATPDDIQSRRRNSQNLSAGRQTTTTRQQRHHREEAKEKKEHKHTDAHAPQAGNKHRHKHHGHSGGHSH